MLKACLIRISSAPNEAQTDGQAAGGPIGARTRAQLVAKSEFSIGRSADADIVSFSPGGPAASTWSRPFARIRFS